MKGFYAAVLIPLIKYLYGLVLVVKLHSSLNFLVLELNLPGFTSESVASSKSRGKHSVCELNVDLDV